MPSAAPVLKVTTGRHARVRVTAAHTALATLRQEHARATQTTQAVSGTYLSASTVALIIVETSLFLKLLVLSKLLGA